MSKSLQKGNGKRIMNFYSLENFKREFKGKKVVVMYEDRSINHKECIFEGAEIFFDEPWICVNGNWTRLKDVVSIKVLEG